jgi:hypothetical protein
MLWSDDMWVAAAALVSTNSDDYKILHCLNFVDVSWILGWLDVVLKCCQMKQGDGNGNKDCSNSD